MFKAEKQIVLASMSPRRRDFLQDLGFDFIQHPARSAEPDVEPGEDPGQFSMRAAAQKAREVYEFFSAQNKAHLPVVIGADTIVVFNNKLMHKPESQQAAFDCLKALGGQTHCVYSGCCIILPQDSGQFQEIVFFDKSLVRMHKQSDAVLWAYVHTGESMDKAGSYAIQGQGAFLIESIEGSWSNIVGLPVDKLVQTLLCNKIISLI